MEKKTATQRYAFVPLTQIEPGNYQRATNSTQVKNIIMNFDEAKLGTLTLSRRDGKMYIVDGAHRLSALRTLGYTHALCEILEGLTLEDEADYFRRQGQDKRALRPIDFFKAGIIAGDEMCIGIKETVDSNDFKIGFNNKDFYQIGAVDALFTIVREYGFAVLDDTLCLIANTWLEIPEATNGDCLLGVAEFVSKYGMASFAERLSNRFSIIWHEYKETGRSARNSAKTRKLFCRTLVEYYNKGLGSKNKDRLIWEE